MNQSLLTVLITIFLSLPGFIFDKKNPNHQTDSFNLEIYK